MEFNKYHIWHDWYAVGKYDVIDNNKAIIRHIDSDSKYTTSNEEIMKEHKIDTIFKNLDESYHRITGICIHLPSGEYGKKFRSCDYIEERVLEKRFNEDIVYSTLRNIHCLNEGVNIEYYCYNCDTIMYVKNTDENVDAIVYECK